MIGEVDNSIGIRKLTARAVTSLVCFSPTKSPTVLKLIALLVNRLVAIKQSLK